MLAFYNPKNPVSIEAAKLGRQAAQQMTIQFIERQVTSVDELNEGLRKLKVGEVDAYFFVSDTMITSHAQIIIQAALAKKLPTMCQEQGLVAA